MDSISGQLSPPGGTVTHSVHSSVHSSVQFRPFTFWDVQWKNLTRASLQVSLPELVSAVQEIHCIIYNYIWILDFVFVWYFSVCFWSTFSTIICCISILFSAHIIHTDSSWHKLYLCEGTFAFFVAYFLSWRHNSSMFGI